jgi:site-specific DNA-adenine methylase
MFSYYGAKTKLAKYYPKPKHGKIIEPFAGSARYSLLHFENDVLLTDVSPFVVDTWNHLIQASKNDILSLPLLPSKISIEDHADTKNLTQAEKYLIGFCICRGKSKPRKTGHGFNSWEKDRERIANDLYKIKHWQVELKSFDEIPNEKATWFIDPPYQQVQKTTPDKYIYHKLDFAKLGEFIKDREGFVIACEGRGADYLPFKYFASTNAFEGKLNLEYIYTQNYE